MPRHVHIGLALSPLLLAACGGSSEPSAPADQATATATPAVVAAATPAAAATPISYDCLPAQRLTVSYDGNDADSTATLTLDGATFQLARVVSASGAKYSTDQGRAAGRTLVWWTRGEEATLYEGTVGGTPADDQQVATCSPS